MYIALYCTIQYIYIVRKNNTLYHHYFYYYYPHLFPCTGIYGRPVFPLRKSRILLSGSNSFNCFCKLVRSEDFSFGNESFFCISLTASIYISYMKIKTQ